MQKTDSSESIRSVSCSSFPIDRSTPHESGNGKTRQPKITEPEFREICRIAGTMFIDNTGYTAAVLLGVYRLLGSGRGVPMQGQLEDRIDLWKRDLWRLFEGSPFDVASIFDQELSEARAEYKKKMTEPASLDRAIRTNKN